MKLLAFDTSTDTMSIAVGQRTHDSTPWQVWQHTSVGGAQASTTLIPAVLHLLKQADIRMAELDAVCFGSGPGSFTGLRTACSVAQGLAFGAGVPVLPVESLLAVAEEARFTSLKGVSSCLVAALLDARMDEMYTATYAFEGDQWTQVRGSMLCRPEAFDAPAHTVLAGNVFAVYGTRLPVVSAALPGIASLPTAAAMLRLAPQLLAAGKAVAPEHALPVYIRDKVAKTTAERAAEKAALLPGLSSP